MNITEIVRQLKAVAFALDKVEVKGRENLDILLGSIQTIERSAVMLERGIKEMQPVPQATETEEEASAE